MYLVTINLCWWHVFGLKQMLVRHSIFQELLILHNQEEEAKTLVEHCIQGLWIGINLVDRLKLFACDVNQSIKHFTLHITYFWLKKLFRCRTQQWLPTGPGYQEKISYNYLGKSSFKIWCEFPIRQKLRCVFSGKKLLCFLQEQENKYEEAIQWYNYSLSLFSPGERQSANSGKLHVSIYSWTSIFQPACSPNCLAFVVRTIKIGPQGVQLILHYKSCIKIENTTSLKAA